MKKEDLKNKSIDELLSILDSAIIAHTNPLSDNHRQFNAQLIKFIKKEIKDRVNEVDLGKAPSNWEQLLI